MIRGMGGGEAKAASTMYPVNDVLGDMAIVTWSDPGHRRLDDARSNEVANGKSKQQAGYNVEPLFFILPDAKDNDKKIEGRPEKPVPH